MLQFIHTQLSRIRTDVRNLKDDLVCVAALLGDAIHSEGHLEVVRVWNGQNVN